MKIINNNCALNDNDEENDGKNYYAGAANINSIWTTPGPSLRWELNICDGPKNYTFSPTGRFYAMVKHQIGLCKEFDKFHILFIYAKVAYDIEDDTDYPIFEFEIGFPWSICPLIITIKPGYGGSSASIFGKIKK